jgi:hypothetical protein
LKIAWTRNQARFFEADRSAGQNWGVALTMRERNEKAGSNNTSLRVRDSKPTLQYFFVKRFCKKIRKKMMETDGQGKG